MNVLRHLAAVLRRRQRYLLVALLAVLHLALVADDPTMGLLCWLIDVGLFILWQPFIYAERRVDAAGLTVIALVLAAGVAMYGWWLLTAWVAVLAALVGGRVMFIDHRPTRIFYLTAFAYLLAALLFWLAPRGVPPAALRGPLLDREFVWGMPAFFLAMLFLPLSRESGRADRPGEGMVDLFYSVFIFLLVAVLLLGSLAFMLLRQTDYFVAVLDTLIAMAVLLLLIGWAWNTHPGFTGVGVFFSRYLLTIGLPFEKWLHRLTSLAASETEPEKFLSQALREMLDLPWVEGGHWRAGTRSGSFGGTSPHCREFAGQLLSLRLYTRHKLSPALVWHFALLVELANEHYVAKLRARELQQMTYLRAVHETGARLTHDVKNLLQSLNNLCYLAQAVDGRDGERIEALLQRQLPQITQRLQQTLLKLQKPEVEGGELMPATLWWSTIRQRYAEEPITFVAVDVDPETLLSAALFDSVADNLLQNALLKRQAENDLRITVVLSADASVLRVCDSGSALGDAVVNDLFQGPVASESGLGIGLYHAAQQAASAGHTLRLASNVVGRVCFELSRQQAEREATTDH